MDYYHILIGQLAWNSWPKTVIEIRSPFHRASMTSYSSTGAKERRTELQFFHVELTCMHYITCLMRVCHLNCAVRFNGCGYGLSSTITISVSSLTNTERRSFLELQTFQPGRAPHQWSPALPTALSGAKVSRMRVSIDSINAIYLYWWPTLCELRLVKWVRLGVGIYA